MLFCDQELLRKDLFILYNDVFFNDWMNEWNNQWIECIYKRILLFKKYYINVWVSNEETLVFLH